MLTALFLVAFAIVFAGIEIEAEGKYGWAEKMPTWYRTTGTAARIYMFFTGGKPLTGYHAYMFFMPLMVFHVPFFMGFAWSWRAEVMAWATYFAFVMIWDYYWFLLNPHYGFKRFRKENVWWHAKSYWVLGRWPHDYLVEFTISMLLALAAGRAGEQLRMFAFMLAATILVAMVAPRYQRWRRSMDDYDDRERAEIFHRD